jgi:plastocyanin
VTIGWLHDVLGPFGPLVTFTGGPPATTNQSFATFTFTVDPGASAECALDGGPAVACTSPFTVTGLGLGGHVLRATATDGTGTGDPREYRWTVSPTNVRISDTAFAPDPVFPRQGGYAGWTNTGTNVHQVVDGSGMGLFDSGPLGPGASFPFAFAGAGTYAYGDPGFPSMTGKVKVPVTVSPGSGGVTTTFTVQWAAVPPPAGYAFDVQIKRPGASWKTWKNGTTQTSGTFLPDAGPGTYQFRGRLRSGANGSFSGWSGAVSITVS